MAVLAALLLHILHLTYSLYLLVCGCWKRLTWKTPNPLDSPRRRIPNHLAILLAIDTRTPSKHTEERIINCVIKLLAWCREVGIGKLTVYDEHGTCPSPLIGLTRPHCGHVGVVMSHAQCIRERAIQDCMIEIDDTSDSDVEYPLTPPPSDYSESRPLSPLDGLKGQDTTVVMHFPDTLPHKRSNKSQNVLTRRRTDGNYLHTPAIRFRIECRPSPQQAI